MIRRDSIMASTKVPILGQCPLGLPEIFTIADMT